jgi:hypothetical protein
MMSELVKRGVGKSIRGSAPIGPRNSGSLTAKFWQLGGSVPEARCIRYSMIPRLRSPLWLAAFSLGSLAILPIVDKKVEAAVLP